MPARSSSGSPKATAKKSKNGFETAIAGRRRRPPRPAGRATPHSTANASATNSRLLKRNVASRETTRLDPVLGAQQRQAAEISADRERADDRDEGHEPPADARLHERVDRRQHARARQERAEDAERVVAATSAHVPDLQHPLLLLHDHRVQEGGADEPRHQRRVLDRIPGPEAAPADLDVGPVRAEQHADAEERPGGERPAARRDDPARVGLAGEQRGHANANGTVKPT